MGSKVTAIDPVCGMTVDDSSAYTAERDGETYYFCSADCQVEFLAGRDGEERGGPPPEKPAD